MKWSAVLEDLNEDRGIISPQNCQKAIVIPIEYLPKGCRVGDVLQINISFDPFSTLSLMNDL